MVTLVVSEQRNQYYNRIKTPGGVLFGASPLGRHFRESNCRSCQSGAGILSSPSKLLDTPVTKRNSSFKTPSPTAKSKGGSVDSDTKFRRGVVRSSLVRPSIGILKKEAILDWASVLRLSPTVRSKGGSVDRDIASRRGVVRSSSVRLSIETLKEEAIFYGAMSENLSFNERWAGPAYSNSPPPNSLPMPNFPPSSLPIPKFQMRSKQSVSVELPGSDSGVDGKPFVKSALASPARDYSKSMSDLDLFLSAHSATKTLRRILNLDAADE